MQVNPKKLIAINFLILLTISSIMYVWAQTPTETFWISPGVYPGATSFSIWREGSNYFSKDAYGQIKYSGTNCTDVTQDSIIELTDGGTIAFDLGTFSITQTILYDENINFEGQSQTDNIGGTGTTLIRSGDFPIFNTTLEDIRHVSFRKMRLQGQGKGVGATALVQMGDDTGDLIFESVTFAESGGDGVGMLGGSYWVTMINCQAQFLTGAMLKKASPNTGTLVSLTNCISHWGGPLVDLYGIKGMTIQGGGGDHWDSFAVKLQLCIGQVTGVDLEGNGTVGNNGHGIWLISGGVSLMANRIQNWGNSTTYHPIYLTGASSRSVVFGNFMETTYGSYSLVFSGDAQGYTVEGNNIDKTVSGYAGKTHCHMMYNEGYQTLASGTAEAGHGDYVALPYAFPVAPNVVLFSVEENDARYIVQPYEINTTHIRVYLYDETAGATEAVDKTINFYAEYKP